MYLTNNNQIGIPMHRRTNTTIEEVNKSIEELSLQWNVSEKDNLKIATCIIGLQLRKIRLMRGKTQSRVAKAVNVTFQQIQKYERGQNAISINIMMKLCEYLDVSVDFFIKPLEDKQLTFLKRRENVYQIKQDFVAR
ncbi:helix-turn-helix domain-containing protein [Verrucomicrobia bacterium]|nr:helix-turn-helix domain-containing protein [Verrucomicrobiota bacterium]